MLKTRQSGLTAGLTVYRKVDAFLLAFALYRSRGNRANPAASSASSKQSGE